MHKQRNNQAGFHIVEAVLAIAVIAALAGTSFALYQSIKQSATTGSAAQAPGSQTQTTPPKQTTTYLHIKEWKVKLPLPESLKDAYYVPSNQNHNSDGTPLTMWIGLKSLDTAGCDANSGNVPGGRSTALGTIIRVNPTDQDPVTGQLYINEYPNTIIGNYAYVYSDTSKSRICAPEATLQAISSDFNTEIKSTSIDTTTTN